MKTPYDTLPDDPAQLKQMITELKRELEIKHEEVAYWRGKLFGRSSEQTSGQEHEPCLFDESDLEITEHEKSTDNTSQPVQVAAFKRQKGGRKPLPASLPRKDIIHDLPEKEKVCSCGSCLVKIGETVSEKLEIIPAQFRVHRHIRYKYACKQCEGIDTSPQDPVVKIAPASVQLIPKSIATAGLLAFILTNKFCDALPFYRQEKHFSRYGIQISRANMSNWTCHVHDLLTGYMGYLKKTLLDSPLIGIDETRVQVLAEPGRPPNSQSYMWVYRGYNQDKKVLFYRYEPGRSGSIPADFLADYTGIIQTDGYGGYSALGKREEIIHAGCWAHVRRKFLESVKQSKNPGTARVILSLIHALYAIEREIKSQGLSLLQVHELRSKKSRPLIEKLQKTLDKKVQTVLPQSLLGKAISYTMGEWEKLIHFLDHPAIALDNNLVENAIRPFVIGRKNWLFSGSVKGANASADLYSIIETAKANGLEPYWYLRYLFSRLPILKNEQDYTDCMPWNLAMDEIKKADYSGCT